jgi:L-threonylcarbamoyladenylate synthase
LAELTTDVAKAAAALRNGKLVAFATETVYGLGGDATNDEAVARIFAAKGRPQFNPLITHVPSLAAARELGVFNDVALKLAEAFWPGPLTLVVPRRPCCPVSPLASAGLDSLAIRVPGNAQARELLERAGVPVVAPSANPSGRLSPTTAEHVARGLGERIELILDGGSCPIGLESTVIACTDDRPVLLRPGGLAVEEIAAAAGAPIAEAGSDDAAPASPGMLASHYAPSVPVRLNATDVRDGEALLAFGPDVPVHAGAMRNLSPRGDVVEAAANLFGMLHELDVLKPKAIAVMPIPERGLGRAINDRLRRAAFQ